MSSNTTPLPQPLAANIARLTELLTEPLVDPVAAVSRGRLATSLQIRMWRTTAVLAGQLTSVRITRAQGQPVAIVIMREFAVHQLAGPEINAGDIASFLGLDRLDYLLDWREERGASVLLSGAEQTGASGGPRARSN